MGEFIFAIQENRIFGSIVRTAKDVTMPSWVRTTHRTLSLMVRVESNIHLIEIAIF